MFGTKINASDRIYHLLLSLPNECETVVTALETQTDLKLDFVKAHLLAEETKSKSNKIASGSGESDEVSFKATGSGCFDCGDKCHLLSTLS